MKDTIAKVLEDHIQSARNQRCICGWRPDWTDRRPQELFPEYRQHREHLATEIEQALLPAMTAATLTNATIHPCGDTETYARGHNDGYETAMAQVLATDELRADEWLEERLDRALKPATELVELAENREGALYCHVTTYELRHALGMDTDNWPPLRATKERNP